ncbi:protein maelstrom homolog [Aricia agestis]|uniref:protein maelstrom homolog n=1 Tax=Aricia agestis TaxID=91739 RepID=UPI001C201D03|nr:protein maelstrom homolog [Aricia agestis]XP_041981195.1 protein maelstrom homolog [Aricia agestis]
MPKKAPKNAFFFYMQSFREEQKKKGVHYESTAEVATAAGPSWKDAPPAVRAKFENMAKEAKKKITNDEKFTSLGVPLSHIENQERERDEAEKNEKEDIINMVKTRTLDGSILEEDFYLMDVNSYCKTNMAYLIGESTLLRFNLRDGVKDIYHQVINPGKIPLGYTYDVKIGCEELGLQMPDEDNPSDQIQILANIIDYLKQKKQATRVLPPIFTMPDKVEQVQDFIMQMCYRAGEDETLFRVYKLDTLLFTLANALKRHSNEGLPKESLALAQLKKDSFKYSPGIGCEHHEETDKSVECTQSRAKRWSYTVLDLCCGLADVEIVPGKHVPSDFDLESIQELQERKLGRLTPAIAGRVPSSCNTTMNDSIDTSFNSTRSATASKSSRVHVPLRMPKTDYSTKINQAPELTEDDFPSLPLRAGKGRGMGMRK